MLQYFLNASQTKFHLHKGMKGKSREKKQYSEHDMEIFEVQILQRQEMQKEKHLKHGQVK